ncbi:BrnA antitoxin family protein [Devosia aurantiaca]|nr:BrnA antitoxin family protein [Devosia aurantiaca]
MTDETWKRISLAEIKAMKSRGELYQNPDAPEGPELGDEFWENAVPFENGKTSVHLKLDADVFFFFKRQGKGHITRMQDVLKAYVRAQEAKEAAARTTDEKRKAG